MFKTSRQNKYVTQQQTNTIQVPGLGRAHAYRMRRASTCYRDPLSKTAQFL